VKALLSANSFFIPRLKRVGFQTSKIPVTIALTTIIGLVVVYCMAISMAWIAVEIERLGNEIT
jgi:hypothetical protein